MRALIYPSKDGWRFRISGNNNEIVATGESYVRRIDAQSALKQVVTAGRSLEVVVRNHANDVTDHYIIGAVPMDAFEEQPDDPFPLDLGDDPDGGTTDDTACPDCTCIGFHTSDCPSQEEPDNAE